MKIFLKHKWIAVFIFVLVSAVGVWSYVQASGNEVSICVKKNGLVYVIGEGFRRQECKHNDTLLTFNVQGQPGPQGETGPQGPQGIQGPAGQMGPQGLPGKDYVSGAGNIAFVFQNFVITVDGRTWVWSYSAGEWLLEVDYGIPDVPIPTSNIVQWFVLSFLDTSGHLWVLSGGGRRSWVDVGSPY